jgi:hypothetical protein
MRELRVAIHVEHHGLEAGGEQGFDFRVGLQGGRDRAAFFAPGRDEQGEHGPLVGGGCRAGARQVAVPGRGGRGEVRAPAGKGQAGCHGR